ncbi:MAG: flagellar basal body L-ring protein FlgH [Candidatus Eisenbacteria bacterium]|nr:flagellar basal body L-ring protein FlgH [Candidatus Eisenbacteria bacterium]
MRTCLLRIAHVPGFLLIAGALLLAPIEPTGVARAGETGSLWQEDAGQRYTNRKAMHVGDLITVIVEESSAGSNRSSLRTKKESTFDAEGGPGKGPLSFIPLFSAKADLSDEMNGNGAVSLSGELSTKLTVQVIEIRPTGELVVEGSRMLEVNGEEDRFTLHGVVRPEDVRADNTVLSTYLAEARISYAGNGSVHHAAKRGIFQRILSWIF